MRIERVIRLRCHQPPDPAKYNAHQRGRKFKIPNNGSRFVSISHISRGAAEQPVMRTPARTVTMGRWKLYQYCYSVKISDQNGYYTIITVELSLVLNRSSASTGNPNTVWSC